MSRARDIANLQSGGVINDASADLDFRIESGGNANMLFVDGGNDVLVIGQNAPDTTISGGKPAFQVIGSGFDGMAAITRRDSGVYGPALILSKSKSTTPDNYSIVANGDTLGGITFIGDDGTNLDTYGASIQAIVDGTSGENDMPTRLVFSTTADGAASPTERMRIDSSGRVGIGATPARKFDVEGSANDDWISRIYNTNTNGAGTLIRTDATSANDKIALGVYADSAYKMVVKSTGFVGIGTSAPTQVLECKTSSSPTIELNQADTYRGAIRLAGNDLELRNSSGVIDFFVGTNNDHDSNSTRAMMIDNSGRVMIGTTDVGYSTHADLFTISRTANTTDHAGISIRSGTAGQSSIYFSDATGQVSGTYEASIWHDHAGEVFSIYTQDYLRIFTGSYERMRIDSSGNMFLMKTSASLGTAGHTFGSDGYVYHTRNGNIVHLNQLASSGSAILFMQNSNTVGSVAVNSSSTTYNTSSDYRLKENIVTDWDATSRLKQLKPSRFNFKADKDKTVDGFLAHEVSFIVPEAVTGTKDEVDEDGNPVMQGIDHSKLVPLLVKTIQELEARIAKLEGG